MPRRMVALLVAACLAAVLAGVVVAPRVAVSLAQNSDLSKTISDRDCPAPTDPSPPRLPRGTVSLVRVGRAEAPTSVALAADGSGDGFLGQRTGEVLRIAAGDITPDVVLDLSEDTAEEGDGGLLALALDPAGDWLYVARATADNDDLVTAYRLDADGQPDIESEREIIRSGHPPTLQHHGGAFHFGADGMLYVGFGDGGGLGDPRENADNRSVLLGKILRIDPTPEADEPYRVPPDNPFVDDDDIAPEIWVYGVRNPFRLGFDEATGNLWLGDVGQSCWDELDLLRPDAGGSNLGWDRKEGTHDYEGGTVPGRELLPVFEINHRLGWCSIVAGPVVRGGDVPALDGQLLFTDYCKGQVWLLDADAAADGATVVRNSGLRAERPIAIVPGPRGRPWVLTLDGEVLEIQPGG